MVRTVDRVLELANLVHGSSSSSLCRGAAKETSFSLSPSFPSLPPPSVPLPPSLILSSSLSLSPFSSVLGASEIYFHFPSLFLSPPPFFPTICLQATRKKEKKNEEAEKEKNPSIPRPPPPLLNARTDGTPLLSSANSGICHASLYLGREKNALVVKRILLWACDAKLSHCRYPGFVSYLEISTYFSLHR